MLVSSSEIGITPRHLSDIRQGRRHPSRRLAIDLETHTGVSRLAWLYPEEFFNPEAPHLYTASWPPSLDHLEGEARAWAERIVAAFPDGPPSKEEFRAWKRAQRKTPSQPPPKRGRGSGGAHPERGRSGDEPSPRGNG